jgi:hypothetical protein
MGTVGIGEAGFEVVEGCKIGSDERAIPTRPAPALPRATTTIIMATSTFTIAFFETNILTVSISPQFQLLIFPFHIDTVRIKGLFSNKK